LLLAPIIAGGVGSPTPGIRRGLLSRRGGTRVHASVTEIHRYPLRPPGFEEPLFPTPESRRAVISHLAASSWLSKASEVPVGGHREPARLERRGDGRTYLVRLAGQGCRTVRDRRQAARRVAEVLERWREVRGWWESGEDRVVYRLLLSDGAVVDLALDRGEAEERAGSWSLVRVLD
jgi:hypothetical protein